MLSLPSWCGPCSEGPGSSSSLERTTCCTRQCTITGMVCRLGETPSKSFRNSIRSHCPAGGTLYTVAPSSHAE